MHTHTASTLRLACPVIQPKRDLGLQQPGCTGQIPNHQEISPNSSPWLAWEISLYTGSRTFRI